MLRSSIEVIIRNDATIDGVCDLIVAKRFAEDGHLAGYGLMPARYGPAARKRLQAWAKANGVSERALPREIRFVDALPVLGTGKLDYVTMTELASHSTSVDEPREAEEQDA